MSRSELMLARICIGVLILTGITAGNLSAGFVGDYDETHWTLKTYGGDGTVDWLVDSFLIDTGFSGSGPLATSDLTVRALRSGTYVFSWTFYGSTSTGYRLARIRNESVITLASRQDFAEGTASFTANAGDTIGVRITAPIDEFPAMAEIYDFFAPGQEPAILIQPVAASACFGSVAVFSVVATNAVDYQWQFKGQNIAEENFEDLVLRAVPPADTGNYRVVARNPLASVTSQAVPLTIVYPPAITIQPPPALTQCAGQNVALSVGATGTSLRYQWRHDGSILPGAIAPSLTLSNLSAAQAGVYDVVVSNKCDQVISSEVAVNVLEPPAIIAQPQSSARYVGESVSFFVLAAGTDSIHSQWQRNGTNLPGATSAVLTLSDLHPADAGIFSVVISNPCGATTSAGATLSVIDMPVAIRIVQGASGEVNIEVSGTVGRPYVLEVSRDLQAWTRWQTNWLVLSGTPLFHDVADSGMRYYRVCPVP